MMHLVRTAASKLPEHWQNELRRVHYRLRIRRGTFVSNEPEFAMLGSILRKGDWVVDIGANVGFYSKRMSELVGPHGRVLAFEPIPTTFVHLANNLFSCRCTNVTLFNVAASDRPGISGMAIPKSGESGLPNYYQAHISIAAEFDLRIMKIAFDDLAIPSPIRLVKIDAEGHELSVLRGMQRTLASDRPILIVETPDQEIFQLLNPLGYKPTILDGSPNVIFFPAGASE